MKRQRWEAAKTWTRRTPGKGRCCIVGSCTSIRETRAEQLGSAGHDYPLAGCGLHNVQTQPKKSTHRFMTIAPTHIAPRIHNVLCVGIEHFPLSCKRLYLRRKKS